MQAVGPYFKACCRLSFRRAITQLWLQGHSKKQPCMLGHVRLPFVPIMPATLGDKRAPSMQAQPLNTLPGTKSTASTVRTQGDSLASG